MDCKYCGDNNTKVCDRCSAYFSGLNEDQIQDKISKLFHNFNKPKPSFIVPYGPYHGQDIRELIKSEEIKKYLEHEYTKLGDCVFKFGLKEVLQTHI